jgi:GR25 family glycosyltransferase involved in LPS biosynthesis
VHTLASPNIYIQVINLARRPDRLAQISSELEVVGLTFEIQVAVDGEKEVTDPKILSKGEVGCWKSHINAMATFEKLGAGYTLILEDDAVLTASFSREFLNQLVELMSRQQLDMLQIGFIEHIYSISSLRGLLDFLVSIKQRRRRKDSLTGIKFVVGEFRAGTHAYLVNRSLAQTFSNSLVDPPLIAWDTYLGFLASSYESTGRMQIARLSKSTVAQASRKTVHGVIDSDVATQ